MLGLTPEDGYGGRFVGLASIFNVEVPVRVPGQPRMSAACSAPTRSAATPASRSAPPRSPPSTPATSAASGCPATSVWRGSAYVQQRNWGLNLAVNNLFNEEYYQSQFLFWDVFIKPSELRTVSLTMNYGF